MHFRVRITTDGASIVLQVIPDGARTDERAPLFSFSIDRKELRLLLEKVK